MERLDARLRPAETAVALACTALLVILHLRAASHMGPLWRDEINLLVLATTPSLGAAWADLGSYPGLPLLLLRAWTAIPGAAAGSALRIWGLLVGLGTLGALWWATRQLGGRRPLLSLGLFALTPTVVLTGDSVGPYGLGILAAILSTGFLWRMLNAPTRWNVVGAVAAAVLAVQCLYHNAVLLAALAIGGLVAWMSGGRAARPGKPGGRAAPDSPAAAAPAAMDAARPGREWLTRLLWLGAAGAAAAASLLLYATPLRRAREWVDLNRVPLSFAWIWEALRGSLDPWGPARFCLLVALILLGAVAAVWARVSGRTGAGRPGFPGILTIFGMTTVLVAAVLHLVLLGILSASPQTWYFLPLLGPLLVLLDAVLATVAWGRVVRVAVTVVAVVAGLAPAWRQVAVRRTSMDRVASAVASVASEQDLIIVAPWHMGVSFNWYYKGKTPWTTVPPLEDSRIHRYDLIRKAMLAADPIAPVLSGIEGTLRSGHRVWIVGGLGVLPPGRELKQLPAPPLPETGWSFVPYMYVWEGRTRRLLEKRTTSASRVQLDLDQPVSSLEHPNLGFLEGWREE